MNIKEKREGGLRNLLEVSLPIIISQTCDSLMMFTDRYLLSSLGTVYPSASLVGGFTSFLMAIPFFGTLSYTTPLVGQYFGAKKPDYFPIVVHQGLLMALMFFPVVLFICKFFGAAYFQFLMIPIEEFSLAMDYYNIVNYGIIFIFIKVVIAGFYTGIGKTKLIMGINLLGLVINIPVTYYLIQQGYGVKGAAFGTIVSQFIICICFIIAWVKNVHFKKTPWLNISILKKYIRFGSPTGLEFFVLFFAFNTFINLFHSYGHIQAFSITIALNWEVLVILPLVGLNIGMMGQVGNAMGGSNVNLAKQTTRSGLILAYVFVLVCSVVLVSACTFLIEMFMPSNITAIEYEGIIELSTFLIMLMPMYLFFDATNFVLSGTLRGSGDTRYCLIVSIVGQWGCLLLSYFLKDHYGISAKFLWTMFIVSLAFQSLCFIYRYKKGQWHNIKVV